MIAITITITITIISYIIIIIVMFLLLLSFVLPATAGRQRPRRAPGCAAFFDDLHISVFLHAIYMYSVCYLCRIYFIQTNMIYLFYDINMFLFISFICSGCAASCRGRSSGPGASAGRWYHIVIYNMI